MKLLKKKGCAQYKKWQAGKRLTRGEAILAHCYECNGQHEIGPKGDVDCRGAKTCPLYQYFPYR